MNRTLVFKTCCENNKCKVFCQIEIRETERMCLNVSYGVNIDNFLVSAMIIFYFKASAIIKDNYFKASAMIKNIQGIGNDNLLFQGIGNDKKIIISRHRQ